MGERPPWNGWVRETCDLSGVSTTLLYLRGVDPAGIPEPERGEPIQSGVTRGGVRKTSMAGRDLYVRTYRHGGILGGLLGDRFLRPARLLREVTLLLELRAAGVCVPEPVFAEIRQSRMSPFVRMRLGTWAEEGRPLLEVLAGDANARRPAVRAAATSVRLLHDAKVLHGDLHLGNLLWNGKRVAILDLDHAARARRADRSLFVRELLRLLRSGMKRKSGLTCSLADATRFLREYTRGEEGWREELRGQLPGFRREILRRSRLWSSEQGSV